MDKQSALTFCIIAAAIAGITLVIANPFDLDLVYAESNELTKLQDVKSDYYYDEYGQLIKSVHGTFDRLFDYTDFLGNPVYVNERIFENPTHIQYETYHGSVILNKETCGFSYFNNGLISEGEDPLFSDSIVPKKANISGDNWNEITQLTDATCNAYLSGNELVSEKFVSGIGTLQYIYINIDGTWKTELRANNNSTATNQKFGFDQTIELNRDTIKFNGLTINLDTFHETTFDKTWIENNESKIVNFLNGQQFDFDLAHENLNYIYIEDTGLDKSKLVFNFVTSEALLPGETLILDPTYTDNSPTTTNYLRETSGSCSGTTIDVNANGLNFGKDGGANCYRSFIEWDISSIPLGITVTNTVFKFETTTPINAKCDITAMANQPSIASDINAWNDIGDGVEFVTASATCNTTATNNSIDLGSGADSDIQTAVNTSQTWWAIGLHASDEATENYTHLDDGGTPNPTLEVTYEPQTETKIITGLGASVPFPYGVNGSWTGCVDGCTGVSNVELFNSTDFYYSEKPLPTNAGSDAEYPTAPNSIDMGNNEILFNFNANLTNGSIQDVSGSNNNATSIGEGGFYFEDTFDSQGDWIELDDTYLEISGGTVNFESLLDNTIDNMYINIGTVQNSFMLRGEWTIVSGVSGNSAYTKMGVVDDGTVSGNGDPTNGVMAHWASNAGNNKMIIHCTGGVNAASGIGALSNGVLYFWTMTFDGTTATYTVRTTSHTGSTVFTISTTGTCSPTGLDEVVFMNRKNTGAGSMVSTFDNLEFCDGVTDSSCNSGGLVLITPTFETGLIDNSITSFPLNFTSTDPLFETTSSSQVGGFVRLNSTDDFNLFSFNNTSDKIIEIGINASKQYVRFDGLTIASVTNDCNLFSWCFFGFDRNGSTFTFTQNDTNKGTGTSSQDFGTAQNNMFYIGYNNTIINPALIASLDEYYINDASDTSTILKISDRGLTSMISLGLQGNVTSILCPAGIEQTVACRVQLVNVVGNGASSDLIYGVSDGLPDAPSITAAGVSDTQIDVSRVAGASDGGDAISHYDLRHELNGVGGWVSTVTNGTIASPYNHGGLGVGDNLVYQWRDRNGVGYSTWSTNATAQTYQDIAASLTIDMSNIGDTFNATGVLIVSASSPLPVTISLLELISNGTTVTTSTPSDSFNLETKNITPIWLTVNDDNLRNFSLNVTLTNGIDTIEIASSNTEIFTREYDPFYFTALTPSAGSLNYTIIRDTTTIDLKMNRDISGTWKAECLTRSLSQAISETGGVWNNQTVIGYYQHTQTVATTAEPYYISCYNDSLLFTTVSYLSSTNSLLLGLSIFDEMGGFMGAPSVLIVILALLSMATGRNFPIILLITASVTGILLALELITLDPGLVVALIVMTGIGLFGIRKFY